MKTVMEYLQERKDMLVKVVAAIVELFKVKTIITLAVTGACVWGFYDGRISVEVFIPIVTMVLTNYFRKNKGE